VNAAVPPDRFREALKKFASGVTVVTTAHGGEMHGLTASSFASVSLDPPLVLVVLNTASRTHELLKHSGSFAVSVLGNDHADIARAFAEKGTKPFDSVPHRLTDEGIPILVESIAWLECDVESAFPGGTHEIVVGRVRSCEARAGTPLIYFERDYRSLSE
jgi:flavin reductase (DIM6/NTAB) family NADH-FMN oxidoreductase RutF